MKWPTREEAEEQMRQDKIRSFTVDANGQVNGINSYQDHWILREEQNRPKEREVRRDD